MSRSVKSSLLDFLSDLPENLNEADITQKLQAFFQEQQASLQPVDHSASPNDTLHVGLCMAGAVSAGAYTAGMMDYLLETLERWETARKKALEKDDSSIPSHKIMIDVMAGTSAGGMTAAITAAAMQCQFPHVNFDNYNDTVATNQNKLFSSWVNLTGDADMLDGLLDTKDIKLDTDMASHRAASMLNSSFIDTIATKVLMNPVCDEERRPYISSNLDIWLALSNINGIRHNLSFHSMPDSLGKPSEEVGPQQGDSAYISHNYRDFIHFRITEKNTPSFIQQVDFRQKDHPGATLLRDAAMATGAFPIGLTARMLKRPRNLILNNPLYKLLYGFYITENLIRPDDTYVIVDGGMMNNEPFEVTRILLMLSQGNQDEKARLESIISQKADKKRAELAFRSKEISHTPLEKLTKEDLYDVIRQTEELRIKTWDHSSHDKFTRTVILVDPFPSHTDPNLPGKKEGSRTQITEVLNGLVNAATGQLLFKVDDIEEAMDADNYSRFLIVPKRKVPTTNGEVNCMGSSAIACGAISGFSGFFNRQYRVHDYLLGRRNCQRFLQTRFLVPAETTNPIFANGYKEKEALTKFTRVINGKSYLPIIPDINPDTLEVNTKEEHTILWPNQQNIGDGFNPAEYLLSHKKALANRLSLVVKDLLFRQTKLNWITRQYLALPFRWPIRNVISGVIIKGMIEKVRKHNL
jgi:hypothetical protein